MENFWIIGGGQFGLRAAETLSKTDSSNKLTIVEKQSTVCRQFEQMGFEVVCSDAIQYLERNLKSAHFPQWIVPAIPLHAAFEWIRAKMSAPFTLESIRIPNDIVSELPNPIQGATGQFFISIADFKCPPNCPEPDVICTFTGQPRPMVLHEYLKSLQIEDFTSVVIQSHQLAPGVGGYTPEALFDALDQIRNTQSPVLLSTACSCHGVMNAFHLLAR
ncbi:MAG: NAD-binding protein [Deltaproteobacteria bacterium]|jgi:hypothetical protein|nr:NAD-binding protein [Deltaproteobacteria bacterium]